MQISERYTTARNTSNLKSSPRTNLSASDVLTAAGMAAQEHEDALLLWGIAYQGKSSDVYRLVEVLSKRLDGYMTKANVKGDRRSIAMECIAWHLYGTCQPCGGRGLEMIPGTPMQSDTVCRHCNGSGKVPLPRGDAHTWLTAYMGRINGHAAGKLMDKLALDMDLR